MPAVPAVPAVNVSIAQIVDSDAFKEFCNKACQNAVEREMSGRIDRKLATLNAAAQVPLEKILEQLAQDTSIINGQLTMLSNKYNRQRDVYGAPVLMPFGKLEAIAKRGKRIEETSIIGQEMIDCAYKQMKSWCDGQQGNYAWMGAKDHNIFAVMGLTHEQVTLVNMSETRNPSQTRAEGGKSKGKYVYNHTICKAIVVKIAAGDLKLIGKISEIEDRDDIQQTYYEKFQVVWRLFGELTEEDSIGLRKKLEKAQHAELDREKAQQAPMDNIPDTHTNRKSPPDSKPAAQSTKRVPKDGRSVTFAPGTLRLFV